MNMTAKWGRVKRAAAFCAAAVAMSIMLGGCGAGTQQTAPGASEPAFYETMRNRGYTEKQVRDLLELGYTRDVLLHIMGGQDSHETNYYGR